MENNSVSQNTALFQITGYLVFWLVGHLGYDGEHYCHSKGKDDDTDVQRSSLLPVQ